MKMYEKFSGAVPITTGTEANAVASRSIGSENKGFKLLKAMGWSEGEGLGRKGEGRVQPVSIIDYLEEPLL